MRKLYRRLCDVQMNTNTLISDSVSLSEKEKDQLKLIAEYRPPTDSTEML